MERLRKWTLGVSIVALVLQSIPVLRSLVDAFGEGDAYAIGHIIGSAIVLAPYVLAIIFTSKVRVKA